MAAVAAYEDPGRLPAAVLSVAVHLVLLVLLVVGVSWQSRHPDAVVVELWDRPPAPVVEPAPEPKPEPRLEPKPEPKVPPKPEPRVEATPRKPDIAIEKQKKAPPKKKEEDAKLDLDISKQVKEQLARELESVRREREQREVLKKFTPPPAAAKIDPGYVNRVRAKIRGNIVLPPDLKGNPEAIFDVEQLPTGEVLSIKLRKPSGFKSYDDAVERAILKSSPLPRPDRADQYQRRLELKFRPIE